METPDFRAAVGSSRTTDQYSPQYSLKASVCDSFPETLVRSISIHRCACTDTDFSCRSRMRKPRVGVCVLRLVQVTIRLTFLIYQFQFWNPLAQNPSRSFRRMRLLRKLGLSLPPQQAEPIPHLQRHCDYVCF